MTGTGWLAVAWLTVVGVAAGWPRRGSARRRLRALTTSVNGAGGPSAQVRNAVGSTDPLRSAHAGDATQPVDGRPAPVADPRVPATGPPARAVEPRLPAARPWGRRPGLRGLPAGPELRLAGRLVLAAGRRPRRCVAVGVACGAVAGAVAAGPVAGLIAAVYGGLTVRTVLRRVADRAAANAHARMLDTLGGLAAELRAGARPAPSVAAGMTALTGATPSEGRIRQLVASSHRLADRTGAPLADLVERIEADARATARARAAAAAQAAGAQATAWLLAGLPVGGVALGYGIGVDPLRVLLHTPVGAACAVAAMALQLGGLAWTDRLVGGPA